MCWSKRSADDGDDESQRQRTTRKPMEHNITECTDGEVQCDNNFCSNQGVCCYSHGKDEKDNWRCVCSTRRSGRFCQNSDFDFSSDNIMGKTTAIAVFSAILGVIVITLFVALVVLQIKYYNRRKKRLRMLTGDDHEMDMISKVDASERGSKKRLILQPGYSWRESVRRTHSKALHKFRSTMSRSVPDDLFQVGLKLAIFGGFQSKPSPNDHQSAAGKADVRAVIADRCLSSGPDVGDGQTVCDEADNSNANNRPIVVQIPTAAAEADARADEDTVK